MLETPVMDALLRLIQRKGTVEQGRASHADAMLQALGSGEGPNADVSGLVTRALTLAEADDAVRRDVLAVINACYGDPEATDHARSLLRAMVQAQPPTRTRRSRQEAPYARVVGE